MDVAASPLQGEVAAFRRNSPGSSGGHVDFWIGMLGQTRYQPAPIRRA